MEDIKVSIVIAVYNVEKYLRRNLDSLVNQTLKDIEIICVNDGSPDNSLDILKEYQEKYKNIVIIDKKNEGPWKARLDGARAARGKYTTILDSDDYVALDFAEKLYNAAEKDESDITVCGYQRIEEETKHVYSTEMANNEGKIVRMDKNAEDIISINTSLWNKLFRTEILREIPDLETIPPVCEDVMFLLLTYLKADKITFINDILYYYLIHQNSVITTVKEHKIRTAEKAMIELKNIFEKSSRGKELKEVLAAVTFLHFGISLISKVEINENTSLNKELKINRQYLDKNFPEWKTTKYLKLSYCIKHHTNLKVAIMKKIYRMHLLIPFIKLYNFMIKNLKIDIKW